MLLILLFRCIAAYRPFQIRGQLLYKGNRCHFQLETHKIASRRTLSIKIPLTPTRRYLRELQTVRDAQRED
jgi:hypothetical protein